MVLLNASSRSRNVASLIVTNQGGGDKKAGLPYLIGRTAPSSMLLAKNAGGCELSGMKLPITPIANQSRPVDSLARTSTRFRMNI